MKMYELVGNYNAVWEMLNNDDTDLQTIEDTLQSIEAGIEIKAENTVSLLKNLEVYSNGLEKEIDRLEKMQDAINHKYDMIRSCLFSQLELTGLTEIKTSVTTIKKQNNPPSVVIEEESLIPARFQTVVPQTYKISKVEIAKELKAGVEVPGAKLLKTTRWVVK